MKNKYNRVMFVTNSLSGGGAERATNILVNVLTDLGLQVSLVVINSGAPDLIKPKCQTFELKREWQGGLLSVLAAFFKLQSVIWKWKPNYLVLNCDIPELLGSLSLGKHKLIAVEHATFPWINRIRLGKVTRKILSARNTKWVAVSKHLKMVIKCCFAVLQMLPIHWNYEQWVCRSNYLKTTVSIISGCIHMVYLKVDLVYNLMTTKMC